MVAALIAEPVEAVPKPVKTAAPEASVARAPVATVVAALATLAAITSANV